MLTAITGINWGDEGKGRMVDLLSEDYDIVIRYQGGNNAGHTVINEKESLYLTFFRPVYFATAQLTLWDRVWLSTLNIFSERYRSFATQE